MWQEWNAPVGSFLEGLGGELGWGPRMGEAALLYCTSKSGLMFEKHRRGGAEPVGRKQPVGNGSKLFFFVGKGSCRSAGKGKRADNANA